MRHSVEDGLTPASFLEAWVVCDTVEEAIAAMHADRDERHAALET